MLTYDVILDVGTTGCQQSVSLYQGDTRSKRIRIALFQNGEQYAVSEDLGVRLHGVKPDGSEISPKCAVIDGMIDFLPTANATAVPGTVRCQIQIRDCGGAVLYTPEFSMQIVEGVPGPELPDGASEDVEYSWEVLSELTASADGSTILYRGRPIGTVQSVAELPETAEENTIAYRIGDGLYRFALGAWTHLTDDGLIDAMSALQEDSHAHDNQTVLDCFAADQDGTLLFNEKIVGFKKVRILPPDPSGNQLVYKSGDGFYVSDNGIWGKVTDDFSMANVMLLLAMKHTHENKTVLDEVSQATLDAVHTHANLSVIDKLSESDGTLLFDGQTVVGIRVVNQKSNLPSGAPNGSVAVVLYDAAGTEPIAFPSQSADEEVEVAVGQTVLEFGMPAYNAAGIQALIAQQSLVCMLTADGLRNSAQAAIGLLFPVVADVSDNAFTQAGITIDAEDVVVAPLSTKKYMLLFELASNASVIDPSRIVPVDGTHDRVPCFAVYAFEDMSCTVFDFLSCTLHTGWNIVTAVYEKSGGGYIDAPSAFAVVNDVDINDYIVLETASAATVAAEGYGASQIFSGMLRRSVPAAQKGLYVKLNDWQLIGTEGDGT